MPQLFQVLKCYKCLVFQIHQTKKSNKWKCKMCGEKQSMKRHYGLGNGKECRLHVQKLNGLRGEKENEELNSLNSDDDYSNSEEENLDCKIVENETKTKSKWSPYIENEVEQEQIDEPMFLGNNEVCLEKPKQKKPGEKRKVSANKKNSFKIPYINESQQITPVEFQNNLIEPSKYLYNESNVKTINKITIPHKTVSTFEEEGAEKKNVLKNSKWAQFVECEYDFENYEHPAQSNTDTKKLFQLCDDADLDDVLDI